MLTHWLPLNGNINNQGLKGNWKSTNISYVNGLFGKSASFTGNCNQKIWLENPDSSQVFSWACWVYLDETATTRQMILSHGRDYQSFGFNISVEANNTKPSILYGSPSENVRKTIEYEILGKWTHIAVTVGYENIIVYINGNKTAQYTKIILDYSQCYNAIAVGKMAYNYTSDTAYFPLHGKICDIRIYDNFISATEVKEISNGLICHYPLSNPYETYYKNLYDTTYNCGNSVSLSGFTKTKKSNQDGVYYNYSCSHSATATGDQWYNIRFPVYAFTAGKSYTISIKVRVINCTNMNFTLRHARVSNDYHGCKTQNVVSTSSEKNVWKEYYLTQVIPTSHVYNGTTYTSTPLIEFYTGNLASLDCSMSFDLKDVQVVESDSYLPFISGNTDGIVYDASGFGNDGITTLTATPIWDKDSIIGAGSMKFNGAQHIKSMSDVWKYKDINNTTISAWIYTTTSACGGVGGFMRELSNKAVFTMYNSTWQFTNGSSWVNINNGGVTVNEWTHYACTFSNGIIIAYKNGERISTTTNTAILTDVDSDNYVAVGCDFPGGDEYFKGKISDFRIYATALSDNEIKNLYQRRFSLDTSGSLFCSSLEEDPSLMKISLNKTGILSSKEIHEPVNICGQIAASTSYIPHTGNNSCLDAFTVYQDELEPGDTATIELDVLWDGFDTSNTDGTFSINFQGGLRNGTTTTWTQNRYTEALNAAKNLKNLVLSQTNGMYHYVATTTALTSDNLSYERANIGLRSNYSNGTASIGIQNCRVYNTKNYIGKEKSRFYLDRILCNNYIEN